MSDDNQNYTIEYEQPELPLPIKRVRIEDPYEKSWPESFNKTPDSLTLEFLSPDDGAFRDHPWIFYPAFDGVGQKGIYMDDESARALAESILHELDTNR